MPVPAHFSARFADYLTKARTAQEKSQHHDQRRELFLAFIGDAYHINADEIDREKYLRIDLRKKGWIDALFRDLVFEFKRSLEIERNDGLRELEDYLRTLEYGADCVGLLTDGLIFEVYTLHAESKKLTREPIDRIDLGKVDDETAFLWLDSYLFSQKQAPPTSADIVQRFGAHSPTFITAARVLHDLLARISTVPAVEVKRGQWRRLLARVYGSDIGNDDLFVRHTFLNQFAKLLAYAALSDSVPRDDHTLQDIITGKAFNTFGVSNLGEIDFFAWMLDQKEVLPEVLTMLRRLASSLQVYDLKRINEDLLKQLYQNLVDPETRHELGEYYTPDWLAELTLREIDYRPGQSLLDPSCGSGTFLFMALRRLADQELTGWELVKFALENVVGMDVHPLAVTVARVNYLLAIIPHMQESDTSERGGGMQLAPLPVYMADTLRKPEEKGANKDTLIVPVDEERKENFKIPVDAAKVPAVFNAVVDRMDYIARQQDAERFSQNSASFLQQVRDKFGVVERGGYDLTGTYWGGNLQLLNKLIREGRNSIWAYILKNTSRPLLLSAQKFDVIIGNPPWLSYRYIQDKTYQKEVKDLTKHYGLIASNDVKLFTQMDLSTLFMVHCEDRYLKADGLIAFVMPRSVITGAKQHRPFQARGLTRVIDLLGVQPLFNVPTAVLLRRANDLHMTNIPTTTYKGRLPQHQMPLTEAKPLLKLGSGKTNFVGAINVEKSPYYELVRNGATLTPRNLCFVKPQGVTKHNPTMGTDPEANKDAKAPWKGISLRGLVFSQNLYATLLSKNMIPFGYRKLNLVALPVQVTKEGKLKAMDEGNFIELGIQQSWETWFAQADQKWNELKKDTSQFPQLIDQYNYMQKLTEQQPYGVYKVLYNSSGVHLASCVMDTNGKAPKVYDYTTQGFIVDHKTYSLETENINEAHYLCALLNAPIVDESIKAHQSHGKGAVGERDIHRTPFEACDIPSFDAANADHMALAHLSQEAHTIVTQTVFSGDVVKARRIARAAVESQIAQIDVIARRVLGLESEDQPPTEDQKPSERVAGK